MSEHGVRDSRLTVIKLSDNRTARGATKWICQCACGSICEVEGGNIRQGVTLSCGCYQKERASKTHKMFNVYDLSGEYGVGYDSKGNEFYFDLDDYNKIKDICWNVGDDGRVSGCIHGKMVRMHKIITDTTFEVIDHINNKPWDNKRSNLRISDKQTNGINRGCNKNNKLGVKGVNKISNGNKFVARIMINSKTIHLGVYDTIDEAKQARNKAEMEYFGEFSYKGGED